MYLLLYAFWLILFGQVTIEICLLGLAVVAAVALLSYRLVGYSPRQELRLLRRVPLFLAYLGVLIWEILKSNCAVIGMLLRGKRAIDPVLVTVRVPLRTEFARFMLANSITLTPGTITVDADSDRFTVHCLHGRLIAGIEDSTFVHLLQKMEG